MPPQIQIKKILVTGHAGFIGSAICEKLLRLNYFVVGVDNFNDYYDVNLKKNRVSRLLKMNKNFVSNKIDLLEACKINQIFSEFKPDCVIHMAAQAGVRYSLENPNAYIDSNIVGFFNILEASKKSSVNHLLYASSSSVYGSSNSPPFHENALTDLPLSFYAATKKSNELTAHVYGHLYGLQNTGLRFFTVYGPRGRPDMALYKFTRAILSGEKIDVFNNGDHRRDFTYIDDVVDAVVSILNKNKEDSNQHHSKIYNIGNSQPINLLEFISILEDVLGKKAVINFQKLQPGDTLETWADISKVSAEFNWRPRVTIREGIEKFTAWYLREYESKSH
jgi:UDP-glucuronate 4-epimerase